VTTPILVFDLETVPDIAGIRRVYEVPAAASDADALAWFTHQRRVATGSDFAPLYLQRVVATRR
jgi:predicted PolB exonuclease-like 3'-5' exonuclease